MKASVVYYVRPEAKESMLRNGSFVRRSRYGLAWFMNGDFCGFLEEVPEGYEEVELEYARALVPRVCYD